MRADRPAICAECETPATCMSSSCQRATAQETAWREKMVANFLNVHGVTEEMFIAWLRDRLEK